MELLLLLPSTSLFHIILCKPQENGIGGKPSFPRRFFTHSLENYVTKNEKLRDRTPCPCMLANPHTPKSTGEYPKFGFPYYVVQLMHV